MGAIGWSSLSPRYAGGAGAAGCLVHPFHLTTFYPPGGLGYRLRPASAGASRDTLPMSYLVDSASSHMLVSKIKPCMSKYKQLVL